MLKALLERWSIPALRVALGAVFVAFGVVKFFPGVSPLESLVEATWGVLTFGIVGGQLALVLTAIIETVAGLALISGVFARFGLVMLAIAFVGILSPIVFFPGELFTAAGPTLLGQYVLKNVVLIAAALVVASRALRGPARSSR
ncbi:DoxX family protein [Agromyces sp. Soil535]|nr:DoxX family protein [Agromyces sp. Soil535]